MDDIDVIKNCKSCGFSGTGNYCSKCGQPFNVKRITLSGLLYDIFHLFTKFERGFGYTLKQLIIAPGHTQRAYIEGTRAKHQKPFSLFFICATFSAITRYWILNAFIHYYHLNNTTDVTEAAFFREYMVILYIALIPLYALIVSIFFYKSGYNYAETGVMLLYTLSLFFLAGPSIFLLKFIWPHLDTIYIEFPVYSAYFIITMVNFFNRLRRWKVVLISLMIMLIAFLINQLMEDLIIRLM